MVFMVGLEDKINDSFLGKIRNFVNKKIVFYSLLGFSFGVGYGCTVETNFGKEGKDTEIFYDAREDIRPHKYFEPDIPPFNPVVCGAESYAWLPPDKVGGVVIWEELALSGLSSQDIDNLISAVGYEALIPVPYGVRNFRLRYTTQDKGKTVEATAVVGVPIDIDPSKPLPVVLWLHSTTGFMDKCAPSADPMLAPIPTTIISSQGFISVAPDYIGMLGFGDPSPPGTIHPYLIGESEAIGSLDAVRAALTALDKSVDLQKGDPERLILWGVSQGGHAAFFTAIYAKHYAPEFRLAGAVAGVPATDLIAQATYGTNHWGSTGVVLTFALTAMREWYGHPEDMTGVLTNEPPHFLATSLPEFMATSCGTDDDLGDINELTDIYTKEFLEEASKSNWEALQPWGCYLKENSASTTSVPGIPEIPFLAVYGELDDLVITAIERESIKKLCKSGWKIEFIECAGKDHEAAIASLWYMIKWIQERADEKTLSPDKICDITAPTDCDYQANRY